MPIGQPDIDDSSLRHPSQVVLGCVKFIVKTNGGTDRNEEKWQTCEDKESFGVNR